jgi:hypothetical protein
MGVAESVPGPNAARQDMESISKPHENDAGGTGWTESYLGGSPEAEARMVQEFLRDIKQVQANNKRNSKAGEVRRAFHAKMQLGVRNAEFRILPTIPRELQVGFFLPGRRYPATVRLSNASGEVKPDGDPDFRGAAIRISTGSGAATDLLMTNAPASHARDARQFMVAAKAMSSPSKITIPFKLLFGLGPLEMVRMLISLFRGASRKIYSLATETFWSRAPIRFGPYAVKYSIAPASGTKPVPESVVPLLKKKDHFLREDLIERLLGGDIVWDFRVQRYVNASDTPIEDGVVEWKPSLAPLETIAQLVIPGQDLGSNEAHQSEILVERLEFNPFNTSVEFRPLGSLNRARKMVYTVSADHREGRRSFVSVGWFGRLAERAIEKGYGLLNRVVAWHKLPVFLGLGNLFAFRNVLRRDNLHDTNEPELVPSVNPEPPVAATRSSAAFRHPEGMNNDLSEPRMGAVGARFGRNVPLDRVVRNRRVLEPNPLVVSRELLTRHAFAPATTLNLLAAAWIQFQVHDWFSHRRKKDQFIEVHGYEWEREPMRVRETSPEPPRSIDSTLPPVYANSQPHWWDGSQIYGAKIETTMSLRTGSGGRLRVDGGLLPFVNGAELTGLADNWWIGLSMMHTLFTLEHNAICDHLHREHPQWEDELLFQKARLVNAALMAKIHTVEWTPAILAHPTLQVAMDGNWWGLLGERLTNALGRIGEGELWSGVIGSPPDHHAAPYSLTEEFVSVYRMHPLMPDEFGFRSHQTNESRGTKKLEQVQGPHTREVVESLGMRDLFYSFGISHPGAITLHNYPRFLQHLVRTDENGEREEFDLAAVDVLRDRERGVPRYNEFRELLHLPRVKSFAKLCRNAAWADEIRRVYQNKIDDVDLMVGLFAETPPKGFGFSDTAFRIFILMATRRLKSDRFFTKDFTPAVYSTAGLEWIRDNDFKTVLIRHYPELTPILQNLDNSFRPWRAVPLHAQAPEPESRL